MLNIYEVLNNNNYPGRGIIAGKSAGGSAVFAYFIMGRSENSRNRIFIKEGDDIKTKAFDESKLRDPSLIIYSPVRTFGKKIIVSNGDQTDTVYEGLKAGKSFYESLQSRCFEPDAPNFTPRISALLDIEDGFRYSLSILKSNDGDDASCNRFFFDYTNPKSGEGHFLHTYMHDAPVLPSFCGEPKKIAISDNIDIFSEKLWTSLDTDNKISLVVRFIDIESRKFEERIYNGLERNENE